MQRLPEHHLKDLALINPLEQVLLCYPPLRLLPELIYGGHVSLRILLIFDLFYLLPDEIMANELLLQDGHLYALKGESQLHLLCVLVDIGLETHLC